MYCYIFWEPSIGVVRVKFNNAQCYKNIYRYVWCYELLSIENAEIDRGETLGGLAPPAGPLVILPSETLLSAAHLGLTEIGTNPDEVGNLKDDIELRRGGDIWDDPLGVLFEFELKDPNDNDEAPDGETVACSAAAAAAAACCCCWNCWRFLRPV